MAATRPNFIGIGAHKAATTWLAEVLRSHPDVFVAREKETHYFSQEFDRGDAWYLRHFSGAHAGAIGEFSTSYLADSPGAAARIHAFDPAMKLIVILRDPVLRAFSHYRWEVQHGYVSEPFAEAFHRVPSLRERGLYHKHLLPYWNVFPEEQILILRYDDVATRPRDLLREVFAFLGVDTGFVSPLTDRVVSPTIRPRFRLLERVRIGLYTFLIRFRMASAIVLVKRTGLPGLYRRINAARMGHEELGPDDYRRCHAAFADDLARLAARTGLDLAAWEPR